MLVCIIDNNFSRPMRGGFGCIGLGATKCATCLRNPFELPTAAGVNDVPHAVVHTQGLSVSSTHETQRQLRTAPHARARFSHTHAFTILLFSLNFRFFPWEGRELRYPIFSPRCFSSLRGISIEHSIFSGFSKIHQLMFLFSSYVLKISFLLDFFERRHVSKFSQPSKL